MIFKNELPLDHEPSLNNMAQKWADDHDDDVINRLENWDYYYEISWTAIEHDLEWEGLEWRTNDGAWT